ncbi:unnamed protein product [Sphenostylis stenocarpa]|uniref:Uncharacterized protein n=1 Tax=Sphenostylis stenocarpa TaxID=92480 RepID=A0AA86VTE3_9FABA|nr:unnamed protein product [Sphenostylis stenocarpa]
MLCSRPSIKQVTLPRFKDPSAPSANDPLSPRISCMGQVKRNNKIAGIPPSHRLTFTNKTNTPSPGVKYSKLKKLFSGKNFIISTPKTTTAAATTTNTISTCRSRQQVSDVPKNQKCLKSENNNNVVCMRSIEDMDPPLPVVKRVPKLEKGKELDSLWRRRSGTGKPELKSLQLQQIHHPRICHQPPTV